MEYLKLLIELGLTQGTFLLIVIVSFFALLIVAIISKLKKSNLLEATLQKQVTMKDLFIVSFTSVIGILVYTAFIYYRINEDGLTDEEATTKLQLVEVL